MIALTLTALVGCSAGRTWQSPTQPLESPAAWSTGASPNAPIAPATPDGTIEADKRSSTEPLVRGQNGAYRSTANFAGDAAATYSLTPQPSNSTNSQYPSTGQYPSTSPRAPAPIYTPPAQTRSAAPAPVYTPPPNSPQPYTTYQPSTAPAPITNSGPGAPTQLPPPPGTHSGTFVSPELVAPGNAQPGEVMGLPPSFADINAFVQEARTGRLMFGVGVNSDAGVTGQIMIDERNFDIWRPPTSWDDIANGRAWRGAGQGFRLEAAPGSQVQRYLVSFTEPYLFDTPISLNLSGFYYDRAFFDWDEQRLGGRVSLGYRLTPDLSLAAAIRAEQVQILDPRVVGVPELDAVVGKNQLYIPQLTLTHDTRDVPFNATEGHLVELSAQYGFGDFSYPRADVDLRKYFLIRERPDGSGRHTISTILRAGFSGTDTPMFENYFAGGFATLRGFDFRGASPVSGGVTVGGRFQLLGSVEYMFPVTQDDMLKGVLFCDYGTVEQDITIVKENFRVAPGFGLRVAIPALGPAPLAFDFAFPIAQADTDREQIFSFFLGIGR